MKKPDSTREPTRGPVKVTRKNDPKPSLLRALRQEAGWDQKKLSKQSGVSESNISKAENCKPISYPQAKDLLAALGEKLLPEGMRFRTSAVFERIPEAPGKRVSKPAPPDPEDAETLAKRTIRDPEAVIEIEAPSTQASE